MVSNTHNVTQLEIDNVKFEDSIINSQNEIERIERDLTNFENELKKLEIKKDNLLSSKNNDVDQDLIKTNPTLLKKEIDELIKQRDLSKTNAKI